MNKPIPLDGPQPQPAPKPKPAPIGVEKDDGTVALRERERKTLRAIRSMIKDLATHQRAGMAKALACSPHVIEMLANQGIIDPALDRQALANMVDLVNGPLWLDADTFELKSVSSRPRDREIFKAAQVATGDIAVPRLRGLTPFQQPQPSPSEAACAYNLLRAVPDNLISARAVRDGLRYNIEWGTDDQNYIMDRLGKLVQVLIDNAVLFNSPDAKRSPQQTFFRIEQGGLNWLRRFAKDQVQE